MKKLILAFMILGLVSILFVACGGGSSSGNGNSGGGYGGGNNGGSSGGSNTVHMTSSNFAQPSITISKGSSVTLMDDTSVVHIIGNGSWVNGSPQPKTESGAPTVSNLMFNGNDSHSIGPFNTAGTYHFYCTVHQNMNLTVVVQ